jgi:hypothetical protein
MVPEVGPGSEFIQPSSLGNGTVKNHCCGNAVQRLQLGGLGSVGCERSAFAFTRAERQTAEELLYVLC